MEERKTYTILETLQVIRLLFARYGKKLQLRSFQSEIAKLAPEVAQSIQLMATRGQLQKGVLNRLVQALQAEESGSLHFSVQTNEQSLLEPLQSFLQERFGDHQLAYRELKSDALAVKLKGEGYVFSRSLDADLEKILQ